MQDPTEIKALRRRLFSQLGKCILDFGLIAEGDRIMVAVSGGKDSFTLLCLLEELRGRAPVRFSLLATHVYLGQPEFPLERVETYLKKQGYDYYIHHDRIAQIVHAKSEPGRDACFLCSRMRRGVLYRLAPELGCNKIALGHHLDDLLETLLMNLLFSGQLCSMPARLFAKDGVNEVIRPMAYIEESDIICFASHMGFPVVPQSQCDKRASIQRREAKALIAKLSQEHPRLRRQMLAALRNVRTTQLLDRCLFDPARGRPDC